MRKFTLWVTAITMILIFGFSFSLSRIQKEESRKERIDALKALASPPPSSLDDLYPPKAEQPIFLFRMFALATPFTGILVDLFEKDFENAEANFERFKSQYQEISKLVPEWEGDFPLSPVEEFGEALKTKDEAKIMVAYEKVGNVCHSCHIANMVKVQQKYHWGNFHDIKLEDPLSKENIGFSSMMQYLNANLTGVMLDVEQGQKENAQEQYRGFLARFQKIGGSCKACHGEEKNLSYVDEDIDALLSELGKEIAASSPDQEKVRKLTQAVGMESCFKCHLVHIPAAFAKHRWENQE